MKKICFFLFLLVGLFSAQAAMAQATNDTTEDWIINYFGATTVVNAGDQNVPINIGNQCTEGINVRSLTTSNCGTSITSAGNTTISCSTLTSSVDFNGTTFLSIFCTSTSPPPYSDPVIQFNP